MDCELVLMWLHRRGMKQNFLAACLQITPAYLSAILQGRKRPSVDVLARMADITGYSVDRLLGRKPRRRVHANALTSR
jgi:transcriptional regulator with XRE-family HTH domain